MFKSLKQVKLEKAKAYVVFALLRENRASSKSIVAAGHTFVNACDVVDSHIHRWS
jgi:predicted acetyltransferase